MIYEHHDYRNYLKQILVDRIQKNQSYSLRAFATQIDVSPSMLSEVLKGNKRLSSLKASSIASKLKLSQDEEQYFLGLVQLEGTKNIEQREKLIERLQSLSPQHGIRDLSIDHYHSVANWICAAALVLVSSSPKGLKAEIIAKRLGVTSFEVEEAMDRWIRLELVQKTPGQAYLRVGDENLMMKSKTPNGALRRFHRSMLEKAIDSLETQTHEDKRIGSETFAFSSSGLEEVSAILEDAVTKILKVAKKDREKSDVYHLGFQFFKLTQNQTNQPKKKGKAV